MDFEQLLEAAEHAFEAAGVLILMIGGVISTVVYLRDLSRGGRRAAYTALRHNLGRTILLGLEILIIADIVRTITIDPTLESVITLGVLVLVRTFLSFSLEIELEGVVPWRLGSRRSPALPGEARSQEAER